MRWVVKHRPSPSMVVSLIALTVALSGTAIAASALVNGDKLIKKGSLSGNRLKNNTVTGKQIKESTLGKVPSASHADSATSATNAAAATTANGLSTLPSGHSESGFYAAGSGGGNAGYIAQGITFPQPLAAAIPTGNVEWLKSGTTSASCPGHGSAAAGHLCLYDNEEFGVSLCCIYDFAFNDPAADKNGFIIYWDPSVPSAYVSGEWTVTAP
jgi:hypothetical protein